MNGDERKAERVRKEEEDTIRLCVHRNHLGLLGMGKLEGGVGGGGEGGSGFLYNPTATRCTVTTRLTLK